MDKIKTQYWKCAIGPAVDVPDGGDAPMRLAVARAFYKLTGKPDEILASGWGFSEVSLEGPSHAYERGVRDTEAKVAEAEQARDHWKRRFEEAKIGAALRCDAHCQEEVAKVEARYARLVEAVKELRAIPTTYRDNCGDIMRGYCGHADAKASIAATQKIDAALREIEGESNGK